MKADRLEIRILGKLEISSGGVVMPDLTIRKAQLLLGYLILRRGLPVGRAQIASLLWPDSSDEVARFNLRRLLLSLRKDLGSVSSRLTSPGAEEIAFDVSNCSVDLSVFRAKIKDDPRGAVALYRGPLLEGLKANWLDAERADVENAYLNVLEALSDISDANESAQWLKRLTQADPLRESAQRKLIACLGQAGDLVGANRVYKGFKQRLRRELNLAPSADTKRLIEDLAARQEDSATICLRETLQTANSLQREERETSVEGNAVCPEDEGWNESAIPETRLRFSHPDLRPEFSSLRSLAYLPNNLPEELTSFVGREREIAQIESVMTRTRLLTLTGSGGCGKSRLSIRLATEQMFRYPDGVWLVELAPLAEPNRVPHIVANALGLKEETGKSLLQALADFLRPRRLLLILDNCEHLLPACRTLVSTLLRACPLVQILATSRESLAIAGEQTFKVPSLSLPDPKVHGSPDEMAHFESIRLFVDRATQVRPEFEVTETNARDLAQVCVRLDGIPLAIELAAAWVRSMNVEDINARLDHRFRLLVGGDRSALPRQQTLRSLIDWSYELLDSAEKEFLARLSVFAGGWPLEAAERICGGKGIGEVEVFDLLTGLVDKSLVVAEFSPTGTRYSILETVRQYGRDRLRENGSEELWRDRHATYFVSLAEIACPQLRGGNQRIWLDRMEAEHDNLRSVLAWSLEGHRDIEAGLRLAGSIWSFWSVRGHHGEALRWLTELFEANHGLPETANLAKALVGAGYISTHRLGASAGRTYYERSLAIAKSLCDEPAIAECLNGLGIVALAAQELTLAASHYTEALAIFRKLDDKRHVAVGLVNLGEVMRDQGDLELARSTFEEGLSVYRELGNRSGTAYSLNYLGLLALDRGDTRKARSLLRESLSMFLELDDRLWISHSLERLGEVAREEGDFAAARSLTIQCLDNMVVLGDRSGIALSLGALATIEFRAGNEERFAILSGASDRIYEELGAAPNSFIQVPAEFAEFWQEGRRMALEMAVKFAKEI